MMPPYRECVDCVATKWCKRYSGESPKPDRPSWCNPRFRLYKALEIAEIPSAYIEANIYNFDIDKDNMEIHDLIKPCLGNIVEEIDNGTNFFFYGRGTGTGKTFTASVILNQYIYKTCLTDRFNFEHPLGLFVVYAELMDDLRYRREEERVQQRLKIVKDVPLLLLDDIGSGTMTDFVREQTYLILNHRFNNNLSTIITSNFSLGELEDVDRLGSRNTSRIVSRCVGKELTGKDRRIESVRGGRK